MMNTESARHRCRNPRCRMKLPAPVDNPHHAFCCRGCHEQFHRARCLVCERDISMDPMTGTARIRSAQRQYCGRRCQNENARFPHVYRPYPPQGGPHPIKRLTGSRSAHSTGIKSATEGDRAISGCPRGWNWVADADCDEHRLYGRNGKLVARLGGVGDRWYLPQPKTILIQSAADLEAAKRLATSMVLAALPLDPTAAAQIARAHSKPHPMGPPIDRPRDDAALSNFKIRECGANTYLDPGPIPDFLRRAS
jgi:hypothetical protein